MKKTLLAVMLLACLAFSLAACGTKTASSPSETALPSAEPAASAPVPTLNAVLPGSDLSAPETSAPQEADATPAYDEALFEAAKRCIDQDVARTASFTMTASPLPPIAREREKLYGM